MKRIPHVTVNGIEFKRCGRCGGWGRLGLFGRNRHNWDGLQNWCDDCRAAYYVDRRDSPYVKGAPL